MTLPAAAHKSRACAFDANQDPRRRSAAEDLIHSQWRRSGQEVFVDTSRDCQGIRILEVRARIKTLGERNKRGQTVYKPVRRRHCVVVLVEELDAEIEALGHVILEARAAGCDLPVVVAPRYAPGQSTREFTVIKLRLTEDVVGLSIVVHLIPAAEKRLMELRRPVVLVASVYTP